VLDKDAFRQRLASNIERAMWDAGLSSDAMARRMGLGRSGVKRWKAGHVAPSAYACELLADALGITLDDLFQYESRRASGTLTRRAS